MKVDRLEHFDTLGEGVWKGLVARTAFPSPFLSWPWQTAWYGAFGEGRRLSLLGVRDHAGEVVALLSLYEHADGESRFVGGMDVSDYLDVIAPAGSEEEVWSALLQGRGASTDVWDLHAIRGGSPTAVLLPALAPAYGLTAECQLAERCPVLDLPGSWDAFLARLTSKHRHELLRKMRRLDRELPGTAANSYAAPADVAARLDDFLTLHRGSRTGKARFMDGRMAQFFRTAIVGLAERGMARLWLLERDRRALATFVCLEWPGHVGLYNSGFDVQLAAVSPGIALLGHVVRDAIERGIGRLDFLRGEEPYKLAFGASPEDLYRIRVSR